MKLLPPDCRSCGACCVSPHDQPAFCDVVQQDLDRLSKRWVKKNVLFPTPFDLLVSKLDKLDLPYGAIRTKWVKQRSGILKGTSACVCAALQGSVLNRVHCSIYERRPNACKEAVKPGDSACRVLRQELLRLAGEE